MKMRMSTEKKKGGDGKMNREGGAKRRKKNRGGIDGSIPKEKVGEEFNNIKCKYMYILSFFQYNLYELRFRIKVEE